MTAAIERRMNGWSDLPAKLDRLGKSINPAETRVLGNLADEGKPWAWTAQVLALVFVFGSVLATPFERKTQLVKEYID